MKEFRYIEGKATLEYDRDKCVGCGMCAAVCPHGVFIMNERKAEVVDHGACMECGACSMNCPVEAVSVTPGVGCAALIIRRWLGSRNEAINCC
ncbi:mercury methylation ferredoxin HgcB [Salidesulfovibrio brasiliensis]|uniref:mercury methylation ferredoxin HgcB n=1 Tax=Salidesulfovibrio brasiliensis TaxID=221711 RepID=UPI0006D19C60|nr:mercury methylation ferredoxin HgcB [Salidesulfovibrio brasiliensis]